MALSKEPKPSSTQASFNVSPGAMFVTNTIPDITPQSGVVALCPVPNDRAGMDDLGWHVVDFLAFKALFRGEVHHRAQTWLAQCDIAELVRDNPEQFVHGKERRLVSGAAEASSATSGKGNTHVREDHIKVEQSAFKLREEFLEALSAKAKIAEKNNFPLFIIICGLTTLEQDVFFGKINIDARLTSIDIRRAIGNNIDATMITPALFSAGWQINPSFCRHPSGRIRAERMEFFARQCGGVFANEIVPSFEQWACPLLDVDQVDEGAQSDSFPGPAMPSEEQRKKNEAMKVKLHSALAGRLSSGHWDHSFNFDDKSDHWVTLIGPRVNKQLSYWRTKWELLGVDGDYTRDDERLYFLGNAFGGNVRSQVTHVKDLIAESMVAWPEFWSSFFGQKAGEQFRRFMIDPSPEHVQCHEMFSIMEHRASSAIFADSACDYFALPKPYEERCRDWRERSWKNEASSDVRMAIIHAQREVTGIIPGVNLPPGVSFNHLSVTQRSLEVPASYISVSLCLRYPKREELQDAVTRLVDFCKQVKARQIELLLKDEECEKTCIAWLNSINMPTRPLPRALVAVQSATALSATAEPVSNWPVLQDVNLGTAAVPITTPSVGHAAIVSPPAPAPGVTENKAERHGDLSASQGPDATPSMLRTGPLYDHRRDIGADATERWERLDLEDVKSMLAVKLAKRAQLYQDLETAPLEKLMEVQKELVATSSTIAWMQAEVRLKEHEKHEAQGFQEPTSATPASAPHPVIPAKEQDKPKQNPATIPSPLREEELDKSSSGPKKTPQGQIDLFDAWKLSSRRKHDKAKRELEEKPDLYTSNPWGQYRHKEHWKDTDDEDDDYDPRIW